MPAHRSEGTRRLFPSIFDTDWMLLRTMRREISAIAEKLVSPGMQILDFGCGDRPYEVLFTQRGAYYVGADFGAKADISVGEDGQLRAPADTYDFLLSFQVLEHVPNIESYLAEAKRVLRPGGRLVLSTHGTWLYHPHPRDYRRWTRAGLIYELGVKGFQVDQCVACLGPLAWTTVIWLTGAMYVVKRIPLIGHMIGHLLALIMNARALIEDAITPSDVRNDNARVYILVYSLLAGRRRLMLPL